MRKDNMGVPDSLAEAVFPRQFRWLFIPSFDPEIQTYARAITPFFVKRQIELEIYEMVNDIPDKWISRCMKSEEPQSADLIFLDGCGEHLFGMKFTGLKLIYHKMDLNYASSEVAYHNCTFSYLEKTRYK